MWLEAVGTFGDRTARVRTQIQRSVSSGSAIKTNVAVYAGGNVTLTGTGQIGNVDLSQSADIYAGGTLSRTDQTCLRIAGAVLGGGPEQVKDWMLAGESWLVPPPPASGGQDVPSLDEVIPPDMVQTWMDRATNTDLNGVALTKASLGNYSYTCPYPAAKVVGDLQLSTAWVDPTYTFNTLYVTGNLHVGSGTALTKIDRLYVGGNLTVDGGANGQTTVEQDWGDVFVNGDVSITGGQFCAIDLLVTNGKVTVGNGAKVGGDGIGTNPKPTLFVLANDGKDFSGYGSSDALVYGVVYTKTGNVNVTNGNHGAFEVNNGVVTMPRQPFLRGAIFAGGNVLVEGGASVAYDADVMNGLPVTQTVPVLQIVPGTWQELSPSGE